jgi:hypothetical protein
MTVHDIDMDDLGSARGGGTHLFAQPGEVRGKN